MPVSEAGILLPEAMQQRFDRLAQTLREIAANKTIYYVANPGNWGDGLIRAGTLRFLAAYGINVTEQRYKTYRRPLWLRGPKWLAAIDPANSILLFGGGGGWCEFWNVATGVQQMGRHFSATVVLPSSLEVDCSQVPARFFCRDDKESLAAQPHAIFCDDMAFCLAGRESAQPPSQATGYFFRTDKESIVTAAFPDDNRDLSLEGSHFSPADDFFAALEPFAVLHTDRLHVAIAGALLGREVHLYPGGYFKNFSVFRSSLQGNFPNVTYHAQAFGV